MAWGSINIGGGGGTAAVAHSATLSSSSWADNLQTVQVEGVSATEAEQMITVTPAMAYADAYAEAGIKCIEQGAGYLKFRCESAPSTDLSIFVVVQEVG